ncbi:MAG: Ldh family oxidoreductase [bacterium]|nr:Ldh family oxidoreductase [bacterium]
MASAVSQPSETERVGDLITVDDLTVRVTAILAGAGLQPEDAALAADLLVFAQRSGIDSHGVMHLPAYVRRLCDGSIKARPAFVLKRGAGAAAVLGADDALGCLAAWRAMHEAIALAREQGVGMVAVRRSSHMGAAAPHVLRAAEQGFVALLLSNASATMAPWGGRDAILGTNPLAAAFPRAGGRPVLIDMATSAGSRAVMRQAARAGEPIPDGWALDAAGRPTRDAAAALDGTVQPVGGAKGYALSMMIELLCSALAGGAPGFEVHPPQASDGAPCQVSHLAIALDPDRFAGSDSVANHVAALADHIQASAPADPDQPVRIPGSRAAAHREASDRDGLAMTSALANALHAAETLVDKGPS